MTSLTISKGKLREAEAIARRIPATLERRGLHPAFSDWILTQDAGLLWLFGVLDLQRVEKLEQYTGDSLLHHLSTDLGGRPVYLSNTSGLRYAVLLSPPPTLPRKLAFPEVKRGYARIGRHYTGATVAVRWERLGHLLVAGKTGSGKSTFLRLLAYQGLQEGMRLLIADRDGATFPMLAEHPALLAPIAHAPDEVLQTVEVALGECDHRAARYRQMPGYPEKLVEYNALAVREGVDPLPRLLVILDEFNATVMEAGGAQGPLATAAAELGWRGRKFGVTLIFAAQDFIKGIVGRVRDQVGAVVCFRVRNAAIARNVGCEDAAKIPESRPGLAVTDQWGPVQTYYLDKGLLIAAGESKALALSEEEQRVAWLALEQGGKVTQGDLKRWGLSTGDARRLLDDWRLRGWVAKDPERNNAHYVTDKLADLIGKPENPENPTNRCKPPGNVGRMDANRLKTVFRGAVNALETAGNRQKRQ
jgi:energy-coupling factor transporter ATP-binding protein EcfA2